MTKETEQCRALSKVQQKMALSGSKKIKKKRTTLKPVLLSSLPTTFRQVKKADPTLASIFSSDLRKAIENDVDKTKLTTTRSLLTLGINATHRHLKKEELAGVVVCPDIQPAFLVDHLVRRCESHRVPITKIPELRSMSKETLGFSCICIGLKKMESFKDTVEALKNVNTPDADSSIQIVAEEQFKECARRLELDNHEPMEKASKNFQYLKRTSNMERAFVPVPEEMPTAGFISIANQDFDLDSEAPKGVSMTTIKNKKKRKMSEMERDLLSGSNKRPSFIPAKVKRLASNIERKKKKIKT